MNNFDEEKLVQLSDKYGLHKKKDEFKPKNNMSGYGLGVNLFTHIAVAMLMGHGIDKLIGNGHWGIVIFMILGFVSGFRQILKQA